MARHDYHFVTRWRVLAPREEVFAVLTNSKELERWWPSVYRRVEQLSPPRGSDGIGKSVRLHTQGWLPYRLCWELVVVEYEPPRRLGFETTGDFVGKGLWTFSELPDGTEVRYEWDVRAEKPLLQRLSFLLRPLFTLNHRWAMARGLDSLSLELQRRSGREVPPPPQPVSALWSSTVLLLVLAGVALAIAAILR